MASAASMVIRRAVVVDRLAGQEQLLSERFGLTVSGQPLTNKDPQLKSIQQLENLAELLDQLIGATEKEPKTAEPEAEAKAEAAPVPAPVTSPVTAGVSVTGTPEGQKEKKQAADKPKAAVKPAAAPAAKHGPGRPKKSH